MDIEALSTQMQAIVAGKQFIEERGRRVLGFGLTALFLFKDGSALERRRAVVSVFEEYIQMTHAPFRWQSNGERTIDLSQSPAKSLDESPGYGNKMRAWENTISSGDKMDDTSAYEFSCLCAASWNPVGVSYVRLQMPLQFLRSDFIVRFQRFASMLCADQAYGGVGILQSPVDASKYGHLVYAVASQYPGLEVFSSSLIFESLKLADCMGAVNWITAVSDRYLARIGGWEIAARGLDPRIAIYKYEGGVIFQAGAKPDLGDASKGLRPELYCQVARALKPLRYSGKQSGFYRPSEKGPTLDAENTAKWLERFD